MRRRRSRYKHELTKSEQIKKVLEDKSDIFFKYATAISLLEPILKDIFKLIIKAIHFLFK